MKTITLHNRIRPADLFSRLQRHLNPLFQRQRHSNLTFKIEISGEAIEISQPELYGNEILFKIEVAGSKLNITRSEHYVDDVNSLTIESIINNLFKDIAGKGGTDLLQEG